MIQSGLFWLVLFSSCLIYWLLPWHFRFRFLAGISFVYLSTLDIISTVILFLCSYFIKHIFDSSAANKTPIPKITWIVISLGILLCAFKALPNILNGIFANTSILFFAVPLGVSYYTFKLIHYAVERSRGNLSLIKNDEYFCWLYLFPIFTAGPIERLDHFNKERSDNFNRDLFIEGLWRLMHGLIKKFIFVDFLITNWILNGKNVESVLELVHIWPVWQVWAFFILLYLIFYFEFSAYSDIAIGASRLYGFRIMENFNWPVLAINIGDFWKRWHMTLAGFCQSYVYMPIIARTRNPYIAIYCTFITMGLWHAVNINYLLWGLYHATGVATVLTLNRIKRNFGWTHQLPGLFKYWGVPITFLFISASGIFSGTNGLEARSILIFVQALLGLL